MPKYQIETPTQPEGYMVRLWLWETEEGVELRAQAVRTSGGVKGVFAHTILTLLADGRLKLAALSPEAEQDLKIQVAEGASKREIRIAH